jgi:4-oxalocrotonate tautomerase
VVINCKMTIMTHVVKILNISKEEVIILFTEATHGNWYAASVRL